MYSSNLNNYFTDRQLDYYRLFSTRKKRQKLVTNKNIFENSDILNARYNQFLLENICEYYQHDLLKHFVTCDRRLSIVDIFIPSSPIELIYKRSQIMLINLKGPLNNLNTFMVDVRSRVIVAYDLRKLSNFTRSLYEQRSMPSSGVMKR